MPISGNVLDRQFARALPNQAWVSDITYIRTRSGWLYLAAVLDMHSHKTSGLGHGPGDARDTGLCSFANGHRAAQSGAWANCAFGPGNAVR